MQGTTTSNPTVAQVRPRRRRLLPFITLVLICAVLMLFDASTGKLGFFSILSPSGPTLQVPSPICGTWELKPAPFAGVMSQMDVGGLATSPSGSVWALGDVSDPLSDGYQPAMARWEGNRWRMVGLPDVNREKAYLASAHFISDNEGWAVGHSLLPGPGVIALHWNGWSWSLSPMPPVLGALHRVRALAEDDVWAVGWQNLVQPMQHNPLVLHWDGTTWDAINLPVPHAKASLYDVLPITRDNVWAVGGYDDSTSSEPLIVHWDGLGWQMVPAPTQCSGQHTLMSLAGTGANDIWAVGFCEDGNPAIRQKLVEHWDGTRWTISTFANQEENYGRLTSVVALSSNDVWSIGTHEFNGVTAFVQHWDGSDWQRVGGPPVTWSPQVGWEFASVSSSEFWLQGYGYNSEHPLIARFVRCP